MDAEWFDAAIRHFGAPGRRTLLAGIAASGLAAMTGIAEGGARKKRKKKKKKCKGGARKCGKTCVPSGDCRRNAECGAGGACLNGRCICSNGFVSCQNTCIPEDDCCSADGCCTDDDCATGNPCISGFCSDGSCEQVTHGNGSSCGDCSECQSGVCTSTSQCAANEQCLGNGSCATPCNIDADCPGCQCSNGEGPDEVCRVGPTLDCGAYPFCVGDTTAGCPAGTFCSDKCGFGLQCIPLC